MLTKERVLKILENNKDEIYTRFNVNEIGIFGSYVRDDHDESSDIDILVEFSEPIGWEIVDLKEELEELLNKSVDLVTKDALKPRLKSNIMDDVVYA